MALSFTDHKRLAKKLIKACGGFEKAHEAAPRVSVSQLHGYTDQNTLKGGFMPADVISDLEGEAREPIYSRALVAGFEEEQTHVEDLKDATTVALEDFADLNRAVRVALADGDLTASEQDELLTALERMLKDTTALRDTVRAAREPVLRAIRT